MVTAIVLIRAMRVEVTRVAEALAALEGVSEVYSVGGRYDLVAILRVSNNEEMARLVTQRMALVEGIRETETMPAFQAFSRHDLEAMFTVGE